MSLPPGVDLSQIPLAPNPSGASPNFDNPPTLLREHNVSGIVLLVAGGLFVVLRLWTNLKIAKKLHLDDYLCIIAQLGGIGYFVLTDLTAQRITSRHIWDIPVAGYTPFIIKIIAVNQFFIAPTLWASKSAILALYIRMFGTIRWLRLTSYILMAFMTLFYGAIVVVYGVYCIPRKGEAWDGRSVQRCNESTWSVVVVGVFAVIADIIILVLPFPVILKLRLHKDRKLSLAIVFSTGIILVVLSAVSLWLRVVVFRGVDAFWNGTILQIITFAEVFGTIMVSCAPALSAFWFGVFTKSTIWSRLGSSSIFYSRSRPSQTNFARGSSSDSNPKKSEQDQELEVEQGPRTSHPDGW